MLSSRSVIASSQSSRSTRCARSSRRPFPARTRWRVERSHAAPRRRGRRRCVGTGVPLVRPRRRASRDRPRAASRRTTGARVELARRPRPVDGAPLGDHRQRVDPGVRRRPDPRRERALPLGRDQALRRSSRSSTATGSATSSSRGATSRSSRPSTASPCSTPSGRSSTRPRRTAAYGSPTSPSASGRRCGSCRTRGGQDLGR